MAIILMIDGLGKRYGMLPSEVLNRSNTLDLYVMDAALSFESYHHKKAMNKGIDPAPNYSTDELINMLHKPEDNQ